MPLKYRVAPLCALLLVLAVPAQPQLRPRATAPDGQERPPLAANEAEKRILEALNDATTAGELHLNVPATDGRMLRLLAESANAKNVVEIGTSTGMSGLWICLGLLKTGGRLTTFELDPQRIATARAHFATAGLAGIATVVEGDAHQNIRNLPKLLKGAPIDMAFIDAEKEGYVDYLNQLLPMVRPGGLILAHNIIMVQDYVKLVSTNPLLETVFFHQGAGIGITLKKR